MRIIDKNTDFYDYLQDPTDTIVFDRRNSFLLTKEDICNSIPYSGFRDSKYRFILLQCGASFWLFLLTITKIDKNAFAKDYNLKLLINWKNYNKPNKLLSINIINFGYYYKFYNCKKQDIDIDLLEKNINDLKDAIDHNNFNKITDLSNLTEYKSYKSGFKKEIKTFPLLKACGMINLIDAQTLFCDIEEYFSIEKMKIETTEPKGVTNNDKIIMHGFDTKISFRN